LKVGDRVLRSNGKWTRITRIEYETKEITVYNFEVEGNHSYFVGELGVLSHNCPGVATAELGEKLKYLFGQATGRLHNLERSAQMQRQLNSIGIFDNPEGRELLTKLLNDALNNPNTITGISSRSGYTIREFLIVGPSGVIKAESYWDGNVLKTVELFGRGH